MATLQVDFRASIGKAVTTTFNNFESYAEAIQDVDLDVRLLQPNERCWSIQQRELGTLRVQYGIEGSGLLTRGAVKPDGWALYVQRSGDPVPVNGKLLMDHSIAVLPPRSEFCFSGQGRIEWYSVFVPSVLIFPTNDTPAKSRSVEVITVRDQLFGQLRSTLDAAFDVTASRSSAASSEFLEAAISEKLISAFRGFRPRIRFRNQRRGWANPEIERVLTNSVRRDRLGRQKGNS